MPELNPLEKIERAETLLYDAVSQQQWQLIADLLAEGARGVFLIEHAEQRYSPLDLAKILGAPEEVTYFMEICNLPSTHTVRAIMQRLQQNKQNAQRD